MKQKVTETIKLLDMGVVYLVLLLYPEHNVWSKVQWYNQYVPFVLQNGVGPRTIQSLALVSELVYGKPTRFSDPARYSFSHGGKDGHPFPVLTKTYDEMIETMQYLVNKAKADISDKRAAFKTLHQFVQNIENTTKPSVDVDEVIAWERKNAKHYGGRTVFDD